MINRNFLIMLFVSIFLVTNLAFSTDCYFTSNSSDCPRFSSSFVTFTLNIEPSDIFSGKIDAVIYNKKNPSNKIPTTIEGNIIKNLIPFTDSGVYVLEIKAYNKGTIETLKKFEYIFDNLEPLPPQIPLNLYSDSNTLSFIVESGNKIITKVNTDSPITFNPNNQNNVNVTLILNSGLNLVTFQSLNSMGIVSKPIQRIIFGNGKPIGDENVIVSTINILDNLEIYNPNTIFQSGEYITSKRNFYIQGSTSANSVVYINGVKTLVDSSGKFGNFVLLNQGRNEIFVKNSQSNLSSSIIVNYLNPNFQFLSFNYDKIVSQKNITITGKTNFDLPFSLYLNGEKKSDYISTNGNFTINNLGNLKPGKNYLYFKGLNNQDYLTIIYYDTQIPKIKIFSNEKTHNKKEFVFELKDDIGIDINSVKVKIDSKTYFGEKLKIEGNIYSFILEDFKPGNYNYDIDFSDRSGKSNTYSGTININDDNTIIDNIYFENNGYIKGDHIFVKSGFQKLDLVPSKFIAFNKIYLDGEEQINYLINFKGEVRLNLNFEKKNGTLEFEFINNNYETFKEIYYYYTDLEKPQLKLDYISKSSTNNIDNSVLITGEVIDSHFNWDSFEINGQNNKNIYGDYFESYINLNSNAENNLIITGNDYFGNSITNTTFGSVLFKDNSNSVINVINVNKNSFNGNIINVDTTNRIKNYVTSWDGIYTTGSYLENTQFELPIYEREGIRAFKISGFEDSKKKFFSNAISSIDQIPPKIYFVLDGFEKKILIDGTLSQLDIVNVTNGTSLITTTSCNDLVSVFSKCFIIPNLIENSEIYVFAKDKAGNIANKKFTTPLGNLNDYIKSSSKKPEIYFSGNDLITNIQNNVVQGQIRSESRITGVKIDGIDCQFDDFNFVCPATLNSQINNFNITVTNFVNPANSDNSSTTENITLILQNGDIGIDLNDIYGKGLFKAIGEYYLFLDNVNVNGSVNVSSLVKVLIDGNEEYSGDQYNNFIIPIDLSQYIAGKDNTEIKVQLKAEDKYGNIGLSNIIILKFNRIIETFVSVFVG